MKQTTLLRMAIIAALFTQIGHTATVFNTLNHTQTNYDTFTAYVFAISLEMAIYLFTCKGKLQQARFFGFISFLINCMYYYKTGEVTFMAVCSIFFSAVIPVTIWYYAKLLHEQDVTQTEHETIIAEQQSVIEALQLAKRERQEKLTANRNKRQAVTPTKKPAKKKNTAKVKQLVPVTSTVETAYNELPVIGTLAEPVNVELV